MDNRTVRQFCHCGGRKDRWEREGDGKNSLEDRRAVRGIRRQQQGYAGAGRGTAGHAAAQCAGRNGGGARQARARGQAVGARAGGYAARSRGPVPGAVAVGRAWGVRRRSSRRRPGDGHRPGVRPALHDRGERSHGEGRHVLSAHDQEASAGPGNRRGERVALHLPGGERRRLPAEAGRGLSRPRALRADLLQSGATVGPGHRADRRSAWLVHGGRRLRAGDVGSRGHRAQPGPGVPGRPAAGARGHGRGDRCRILRGCRRALPAFRGDRLLRRERCACAGVRAPRRDSDGVRVD